MKLRLALALTVLLGALMPANQAQAGAWVPEPGSGYVKLWAKYLFGFGYHGGDGTTDDFHGYHELFVATYGEVGLVDRLALTWHTDLVRVFVLEDPRDGSRDTSATVGDPAIGLRLQLAQIDRVAMSLEVNVRAPLADDDSASTVYGRDDGNPAIAELRIGSGVWNVGAAYSLGYGSDRWYMQGSAGYLFQSDGWDDAIEATLELGYTFSDTWSGRARATARFAIDGGSAARTESPSGIANGTSYAGFALEVERLFGHGIYVGGTVEGGLFYIRRQSGGPVLALNVARRW